MARCSLVVSGEFVRDGGSFGTRAWFAAAATDLPGAYKTLLADSAAVKTVDVAKN